MIVIFNWKCDLCRLKQIVSFRTKNNQYPQSGHLCWVHYSLIVFIVWYFNTCYNGVPIYALFAQTEGQIKCLLFIKYLVTSLVVHHIVRRNPMTD